MDYQSYLDFLSSDIGDPLACTFGDFELTRRCNFSCSMCFIRNSNIAGLEPKKYIEYAKEASKLGLLELSVTGGEVFTRPDFFEIYNAIYDLGILISIMTNGYLLSNDDIKSFLRRPPLCIYITLYGASNDTYRRICRVDNGFSTVYKNVQELLNAGIRVVLQTTLTTQNICDYNLIMNFGKALKIPIRITHRLFDPLDTSETSAFETRYLRLPLSSTPRELIHAEKDMPKSTEIVKHCKGIRDSFCITAHGHLQLCQRCAYIYEDLKNQNFETALLSLRNQINNFSVPEKCKICSISHFCDLCLGGLRKSADGDLIPYEYVCQYAERDKKLHSEPEGGVYCV